MKTIAALLLTLLTMRSQAQEIAGRVMDERREPMINVVVQIYQGNTLIANAVTDYDGNYTIKPLKPGYYDMLTIYTGYDSIRKIDIIVAPQERTTLNYTMSKHVAGRGMIFSVYKKYLSEADKREADVLTKDGKLYFVDGVLISSSNEITPISCACEPAVFANPSSYVLTRKQLDQLPWTSINDIVATFPGVYQRRRGDDVNIFGGKAGGNLYISDGVR